MNLNKKTMWPAVAFSLVAFTSILNAAGDSNVKDNAVICPPERPCPVRVEVERLIKQGREVAAFLAHQAVEKHLKAAWLVVKREGPPRTHSLNELGDPLGVPAAVRKQLAHLNPDYTTARYPDAANGVPYEVYDRDTAEGKVKAADEAIAWLTQLIETKK